MFLLLSESLLVALVPLPLVLLPQTLYVLDVPSDGLHFGLLLSLPPCYLCGVLEFLVLVFPGDGFNVDVHACEVFGREPTIGLLDLGEMD